MSAKTKEKEKKNHPQQALKEQLDGAENTILRQKAQATELHAAWRLLLFRMSIFVLATSMYQSKAYVSICLKDIETLNAVLPISGYRTAVFAVTGNMEYILNVCMAIFLMLFLKSANPRNDWKNRYFVAAIVCIPPTLQIYFRHKKMEVGSCIQGFLTENELSLYFDERKTQTFPMVIVFHVIVAFCYWFMDIQMSSYAANISRIRQVRKEMVKTEQKNIKNNFFKKDK